MKVLICDGEFYHTLSFLRECNRVKIDTILLSSNLFGICNFSRFAKRVFIHPPTGFSPPFFLFNKKNGLYFVNFVNKIVKKYSITHIISYNEEKLVPLSYFKKKLEATLYTPDWKKFSVFLDKYKTIEALRKFKPKAFSFPRTYERVTKDKLPVVVRPRISFASTYVFICNTLGELKKVYGFLKNCGLAPLIQEYIPSRRHVSFNLLLSKKSKLLRAFVFGHLTNLRRLKNVLKDLKKFLRNIGWYGFVSPQFLFHENKFYLTEINPRLSGTPFFEDFCTNLIKGYIEYFLLEKKVHTKVIIKNFDYEKFMINAIKEYSMAFDPLPLLKFFEEFIKARIKCHLNYRSLMHKPYTY